MALVPILWMACSAALWEAVSGPVAAYRTTHSLSGWPLKVGSAELGGAQAVSSSDASRRRSVSGGRMSLFCTGVLCHERERGGIWKWAGLTAAGRW